VTTTDDGGRARLVARAWELAERGYSTRYIAEAVQVSPATAWRMVQEGREAATWVEVLERHEERARARMRLSMYAEWLMEERAALGGKAIEYVPVLLKIEERLARNTGSDASTRVEVSDGRGPVSVDAATVAAIRESVEVLGELPADGEDPTPT
jgi:transposase